jgi:hypothetical protein
MYILGRSRSVQALVVAVCSCTAPIAIAADGVAQYPDKTITMAEAILATGVPPTTATDFAIGRATRPYTNPQPDIDSSIEIGWTTGLARTLILDDPYFDGKVHMSAGGDVAEVSFDIRQTQRSPSGTGERYLKAAATDFQTLRVSYSGDPGIASIPILIDYRQYIEVSGSGSWPDYAAVSSSLAVLDSRTFENPAGPCNPCNRRSIDGISFIDSKMSGPFIQELRFQAPSPNAWDSPLPGTVDVSATAALHLVPEVTYWVYLQSSIEILTNSVIPSIPQSLIELTGKAFTDPIFRVDPRFESADLVTISRAMSPTVPTVESPTPQSIALMIGGLAALMALRRAPRRASSAGKLIRSPADTQPA